MTNSAFWRNKRVFVTGHSGFKGSWLSMWLTMMGASVTGYALRPPSFPNLYECCRLDEHVTSVIGDIRQLDPLSAALEAAAPDIVFHMAAQPIVRASYLEPVETYHINVMGTVHVLEAVRRAVLKGIPVRAVVNITTDKCYDNREWVWGYRETDPLGGRDPYSNSKACSELVTAAYRQSFFPEDRFEAHRVGIASARAGNVIGGGDWAPDRLVPDCFRAFAEGKEPIIRNPASVRPWQHVLEPLNGYLRLAEKLAGEGARYNGPWNFGPDDSGFMTVEHIVSRLCALWGENVSYRLLDDDAPAPHESRLLKLDHTKAKMELGWKPKWSLDEALVRIVSWNRAYFAQEDMQRVTRQQIEEYMASGD